MPPTAVLIRTANIAANVGHIMVLDHLLCPNAIKKDKNNAPLALYGMFFVKDAISLELVRLMPITKVRCIWGKTGPPVRRKEPEMTRNMTRND